MSSLRHRITATAAASGLALALSGGVAAAAPSAGHDPERNPEQVTGLPRPAEPVPTRPQAAEARERVPDATLAERLQQRSDPLDPTVGGSVIDVGSGATVWGRNADRGLVPASNAKVLTALTALKTFGANHRFTTSAHQAHYLRDRVFLKGSGDPTVTAYRLTALAGTTASALKDQGIRSVSLRLDDSLFPAPTNAPGWEPEDVPTYVAPVRALVVDQQNSMDTSVQAGEVYARALEAKGITVRDTRRATTSSTASEVASRPSPELRTIVGDMLRVSQNDYAEALLWTSGMEAGAPRTWAGVTAHAEKSVTGYGVPTSGLALADGSGLSRSTAISPTTLAALLARLHEDPVQSPTFFAPRALPVAGRTGTLAERFATAPSSCATDLVRAKTGSLRDTTALSGIAEGTDGRTRAFSFISNDRDNTAAVRQTIDELAATTVTCM